MDRTTFHGPAPKAIDAQEALERAGFEIHSSRTVAAVLSSPS
jgi:hypothetical protein